jgi:very-short-patch-repair endonuclease
MPDKRAPDQLVADIARRQHGAVLIQQLREAGLSDDAVHERWRTGRLHRLHRGVYAIGHVAPSHDRRWMAAVLALGGNAALSHRSAAALWNLLPAVDGIVDVSLSSRGGRRRRQGIRIHRPLSLRADELTRRRGIPVTSPARTLADLRPLASTPELRRAIRQAEVLGLSTGPDVETDRTRSELERRFLSLCRRHRLPRPAVNMRIGRLLIDFCWVDQQLIVETDGYRFHRGRTAFEDDRARDLQLRSLGYQVMRLSYQQVFHESAEVAAVLGAALGPVGRVNRDIPE